MTSYRFGEFELLPGERRVTRNADELPLGARAFDLLCFLVDNRDRVLTKTEILEAIWPGIAVEESNLTVQISALRKALGPKALATVPGRGYQFVLPVEEGAAAATPTPRPEADLHPRILVVPFANTSNDPDQEYFSDGITEDIITDLSKVSALSVVARNTAFTFKGRAIDVTDVARDMNLTHVIEGSVRKSGNQIRINTQLVDGGAGHSIWADRFDRDLTDIFALQDEITEAIIDALRMRLAPSEREAIQSRPTNNPEAYQLYLLARYHLLRRESDDVEIARRLLKQALEVDPDFAPVWALLSICETAIDGLSITVDSGPTISEESGLHAAERALALDSDLPEALASKANILSLRDHIDEACVLFDRALRLAPDSYEVRFLYGRCCFLNGRLADAIKHWKRASEILETDLMALNFLIMCYKTTGQHGERLEAARLVFERAERAAATHPADAYPLLSGMCALAVLGDSERTMQRAQRVKAFGPDNPRIDYMIACAMANLGETEAALDILETVIPRIAPYNFSTWMKHDSDLDSLRDLPHFQRLMSEMEERATAASKKPVG